MNSGKQSAFPAPAAFLYVRHISLQTTSVMLLTNKRATCKGSKVSYEKKRKCNKEGNADTSLWNEAKAKFFKKLLSAPVQAQGNYACPWQLRTHSEKERTKRIKEKARTCPLIALGGVGWKPIPARDRFQNNKLEPNKTKRPTPCYKPAHCISGQRDRKPRQNNDFPSVSGQTSRIPDDTPRFARRGEERNEVILNAGRNTVLRHSQTYGALDHLQKR